MFDPSRYEIYYRDNYNPKDIMRKFKQYSGMIGGVNGRFGWGQDNPQFQNFEPKNKFTLPSEYKDPYKGYKVNLNPDQWIEARKPYWQEQTEKGFNDAAARFGAAGGLASTPYMQSLGTVKRKTLADQREFEEGLRYDTKKFVEQANLNAAMAEADRALSAWGTRGGWDLQGQLAEMARELDAWIQSGNLENAERNRNFNWNLNNSISPSDLINLLGMEMSNSQWAAEYNRRGKAMDEERWWRDFDRRNELNAAGYTRSSSSPQMRAWEMNPYLRPY